jgi:hypothetical protein
MPDLLGILILAVLIGSNIWILIWSVRPPRKKVRGFDVFPPKGAAAEVPRDDNQDK